MSTCRECATPIQEGTAQRTGGCCLPCTQRPRVNLNPEQLVVAERAIARLKALGWDLHEPSRRSWLDTVMRVQRAVRRGGSVLAALAVLDLRAKDVGRADYAAATVGACRRASQGVFAAEDVTQGDASVSFVSWGQTHSFVVAGGDQRHAFLIALNQALDHSGSVARFVPVIVGKGPWRIAFNHPSAIQGAVVEWCALKTRRITMQ